MRPGARAVTATPSASRMASRETARARSCSTSRTIENGGRRPGLLRFAREVPDEGADRLDLAGHLVPWPATPPGSDRPGVPRRPAPGQP